MHNLGMQLANNRGRALRQGADGSATIGVIARQRSGCSQLKPGPLGALRGRIDETRLLAHSVDLLYL